MTQQKKTVEATTFLMLPAVLARARVRVGEQSCRGNSAGSEVRTHLGVSAPGRERQLRKWFYYRTLFWSPDNSLHD